MPVAEAQHTLRGNVLHLEDSHRIANACASARPNRMIRKPDKASTHSLRAPSRPSRWKLPLAPHQLQSHPGHVALGAARVIGQWSLGGRSWFLVGARWGGADWPRAGQARLLQVEAELAIRRGEPAGGGRRDRARQGRALSKRRARNARCRRTRRGPRSLTRNACMTPVRFARPGSLISMSPSRNGGDGAPPSNEKVNRP